MAAKLTVLIPCMNERRNIRPCIESVRSIADELLIADSGSTDGTLDIVREMFESFPGECRLIEREYVNSADFKNWAIPQAAHERFRFWCQDDERRFGLFRKHSFQLCFNTRRGAAHGSTHKPLFNDPCGASILKSG